MKTNILTNYWDGPVWPVEKWIIFGFLNPTTRLLFDFYA